MGTVKALLVISAQDKEHVHKTLKHIENIVSPILCVVWVEMDDVYYILWENKVQCKKCRRCSGVDRDGEIGHNFEQKGAKVWKRKNEVSCPIMWD